MNAEQAAGTLNKEQAYLNNIIKDFTAEHADFAPTDDMMTTAQQIKHIAMTIRWFREGAFGEGFDMDFEAFEAENKKAVSLPDALDLLNATYTDYVAFLEKQTEESLCAPMAPNAIMGELPRFVVLQAQADHTAHHRGVLSVYLRLLGITPTMVYAE